MFGKLKKYFIDGKIFFTENLLPKKQLNNVIKKHIKKVGNFGTASLIMVDIDEYRNILENYGEDVASNVLNKVIDSINKLVPDDSLLSIVKSGSVLIFIPNEGNQSKIEKLCKKIIENICLTIQDFEIKITASIGVCIYPRSGNTVKQLLDNLNLATFVSKRNGGNKVTSYYETLSDEERNYMLNYEEIRTAIKKREFVLYYQPIVDFGNNKIYGFETLLRWNHPTKGLLPRKDFINLLEQTGDIHWLGQWELEKILRFQQSVKNKYPDEDFVFSMNLSLKQLLNPSLAKSLIEIVKKINIKTNKILLEITDFVVYEKMKVVQANITRLKAYGFKIAEDDFILNPQAVLSVQKCHIDVIKLERNFLKDIVNNFSSERLLVNLIDYCKKTKKIIICDGIESKELYNYVENQNIKYGSGLYFSKPLDNPNLLKYIDDFKKKYSL